MRVLQQLGVVLVAALTMLVGLTTPASADTRTHQLGTRSLATVLAKDGSGFDRNWNDFDIADNAVVAVLTAKRTGPSRCWPTAAPPRQRSCRRTARSAGWRRT